MIRITGFLHRDLICFEFLSQLELYWGTSVNRDGCNMITRTFSKVYKGIMIWAGSFYGALINIFTGYFLFQRHDNFRSPGNACCIGYRMITGNGNYIIL